MAQEKIKYGLPGACDLDERGSLVMAAALAVGMTVLPRITARQPQLELQQRARAAVQQAQRTAILKAQQRVMQKRLMQKPGMRIRDIIKKQDWMWRS